jgi:hypothetical protein
MYVDVVAPGKGLVTCGDGDFSGSIIRHRSRADGDGQRTGDGYLVETEFGDVIAERVGSYRDGAEWLARHHGYRPGPVVVEHEWRSERC